LRISPTAASRAIADLETSLGVTLLRRTTRSVSLTPEGAAYGERCRRILDDLDDAGRSLRGEDAEPQGALLITAPAVFGRMHILPVINALLRKHPALRAQLSLSDRVVRLAEEGIDVAVRIADLSDSALHAIRIAEVRRVLVASPAYLETRGEPTDVAHLHEHDLIVFEAFAPNQEWRFTAEGRPAIRCEPRLLTNSMESSIDAALDGIGIARALSYQVQDHVQAGRLKYLLSGVEPPPLPINLVFHANRRRTPNVSAFIAATQDYCRGRSFA
jgi:DNA-binding transcriptional LysR family regulator